MSDSQKFVARNRAPRVQIEYDVELYGAEKKVQLPFVMGVMSDLSGKAEQPSIEDRRFLEVDADNFDDRMQAMAPRAQFSVPNTLTGEGSLSVDLTFERIADFTPEKIAEKVDALNPLLEARRQLSDLMAYMDGKAGAEALIENLLGQENVLRALAGDDGAKSGDLDDALESLKRNLPETSESEVSAVDETLADLAALSPEDAQPENLHDGVLASLERIENLPEEGDRTAEILGGLDTPHSTDEEQLADDVLRGLSEASHVPEAQEETFDDVLGTLDAVDTVSGQDDSVDDLLASVARVDYGADEDEATDEVLADLATASVPEITQPKSDDPDEAIDKTLATIDPVKRQDEVEEPSGQILEALRQDDKVELEQEDQAIDSILGSIETTPDEAGGDNGLDEVLAGIDAAPSETPDEDLSGDVLSDLAAQPDKAEEAGSDLEALLSGLEAPTAPETEASHDEVLVEIDPAPSEVPDEDLSGDVLSELAAQSDEAEEAGSDLEALFSGLEAPTASETDASHDDVLSGINAAPSATPNEDLSGDVLSDLAAQPDDAEEAGSDLDALLADLGATTSEDVDVKSVAADVADASAATGATPSDLDALLSDLQTDEPVSDSEPDCVTGSDEGEAEGELDTADLDSLLADLNATEDKPSSADAAEVDATGEVAGSRNAVQNPFGSVAEPRPVRETLHRPTFRMAIFGDFTGRSARGLMETGDELARRSPVELDVDSIEDVIARFATTLSLPFGDKAGGIEVKLSELDDLHPDELYDNLEIFEALRGLRQKLDVGSMADGVAEKLKSWSDTYSTTVRLPERSASTSVPANLRLSDFQKLIGDNRGTRSVPGPADDIIARIVGPHIVKSVDAGVDEMKSSVDDALSSAMRMILHHPDFQAVEAQWRALDLLARRIETDSTLQIVLYDVSAEELAADLAAQDDLGESGIFRLLNGALDPEEGPGGFSALFGLYTFEETPPHAELLARMAQVAAHVDSPFFSAISPEYLATAMEDRHPLVAKAWDALRNLPEAGYLGLASPRFLLRNPYGAKSEPIYAFEFEEFNPKEGLRSMLWANPVVLIAILLAGTYKKDGPAMNLGSLMSLGDLPFHYVKDRYGDQVALPCTERNLTSDPAQITIERGFMPVVWMKGRNEVRLGSFRAVGGSEIIGPWSGETPAPKPAAPDSPADIVFEVGGEDDADLDELLGAFEEGEPDIDVDAESEDEMDPELAALLEGL